MRDHQSRDTTTWTPHTLLTSPVVNAVLSSQARGWYGIEALCYRLASTDEILTITDEYDRLVLYLETSPMLARQFDGKWATTRALPGGLNLTPRTSAVAYRWEGSVTNLRLRLTPALLAQSADDMGYGDPAHVEMIERFNFHDPFIEQIGRALLSELQNGGLAGRLYAESLGLALGGYMLRKHAIFSAKSSLPKYRLTLTQVRLISQYIREHLDQDITLHELAHCVNLSPSHFTRLFKQATGIAPHQYVIICRVERAKELLSWPNMSVAQAAQLVGFYDQSHLIRHFKRIYGVSPKNLRHSKNVH
jgi:AraC family transcriptional regulator